MSESCQFFVTLIDRLGGDYSASAVLVALISHQADMTHIAMSFRELSAELGGRIPFRSIDRAIDRLINHGLLDTKEHPNTATRYLVKVDALRELLAQPPIPARVIPGITPLSSLSRIFDGVSTLNQEGVANEH